MAKYLVGVYAEITYMKDVIVEADSLEEAKTAAIAKAKEGGVTPVNGWEMAGEIDFEAHGAEEGKA